MVSSVAIVGAGAIGAWIGDAFDRAGWKVSMLARGATLEALRASGLRVANGDEIRASRPRAGSAAELGMHDYVFLSVKAQRLPELAPHLSPLIGPSTVVISGTNGIPWWFFHDFGGSPGQSMSQVGRSSSVAGACVSAGTHTGFGCACFGARRSAGERAGRGRRSVHPRRTGRRGLTAG